MSKLILIPSQREFDIVSERLAGDSDSSTTIAKCGWGVLAAAIETTRLIAEIKPDLVLLLGIAGAFDIHRNPVGTAVEFDTVQIDGIGVTNATGCDSASDLGWGAEIACDPDLIELNPDSGNLGKKQNRLLTVCAASGGADQARERRLRFPEAIAEDMEGFAVAVSCQKSSVPVRVIRGFSNEVGDRDYGNWQVERALSSAIDLIEMTR